MKKNAEEKKQREFKYGDLVSVVVPTYKRDEQFERAIKSIVAQSYENLEIIVVDDNAECLEYRKKVKDILRKYDKIKLIQNKKNLGGGRSRNVGIKVAKGKLVAFLDDDDEWRSDKIAKQCELFCNLDDQRVGLIICNRDDFDAGEDVLFQHMRKILATTSHWLTPKKVLEEVGLFEDTPNEQDAILMLKILLRGYFVRSVPENLVVRHFHDRYDGIGGAKLKNTIGVNRLRDLCRENHDRLNSKKQIADVEHGLSSKLMDMYVYNHKIKEAKKEFKIMFKTGPLEKDTIKAFFKIYLHGLFSWRKGI